MNRTVALAAALSTAIGPAMALSIPPPGAIDEHIRVVAYDQMNRTRLVGEIGRETTITFGSDEKIARVVFGQPEAELWLGPDPKDVKDQALQNNLPLWPMKPGLSNMQVTTTTPDGAQRIYQFALVAKTPDSDGGDDPDVTFGLIFSYPQQVKLAAADAAKIRKADADAAKAKARLAVDLFYGRRNWSYIARPNKEWVAKAWPKPEVSDNGQLTAFLFQGNVEEPAIYIVDSPSCGPGGHERLAPFHDQSGMKVIETTTQHFRLRLGDAVMEVCNRNFDPVGQNPGTGTTTPNVVREVVTQK